MASGIREKTIGDVVGAKRGGEVGSIRGIYVGKESRQAEHISFSLYFCGFLRNIFSLH